mgnify:CR=1 FL=1
MSVLPPNASPQMRALEQAVAVPPLPDRTIRDYWDPDRCPEYLLPWLAWSFSVDNWDAGWPIAVRRAVIASSIEIHRRKGTLAAVEQAISAFGAAIAIREWWQSDPPAERGTFNVVLSLAAVDGAPPSEEYLTSVIREIERTKPLSRHFTFTQGLEAKAAPAMAMAARPVAYARLRFSAVSAPEIDLSNVLSDPDSGAFLTDPDSGQLLTAPVPV